MAGEHDHQEKILDLYAVVNHHGTMLCSGHYTAMALHVPTGNWYNFNDGEKPVNMGSNRIAERSIVTPNAYLLFYSVRR